jgi:hypothetical protein
MILILTVITFALADPVLVQEKRQAPEDVMMNMLGKRTREQDLDMLWDGLRYYEHVLGNRNQAGVHPQGPAPPPDVPAPDPAGVHVPEIHVPPQDSDVDRESMESDDDAPPANPKFGYSQTPTSPGSWADSDSDSERWSAPSADSQAENLIVKVNEKVNELSRTHTLCSSAS